jgi:hypothetical protein
MVLTTPMQVPRAMHNALSEVSAVVVVVNRGVVVMIVMSIASGHRRDDSRARLGQRMASRSISSGMKLCRAITSESSAVHYS